MKIVMMGNYAVYFIPRLLHFNNYLKEKGHQLIVIEESNNHRLYSFANDDKSQLDRIVLSSDQYLPKNILEQLVEKNLNEIQPDVVITGFISFPFAAIGLRWAKKNNTAIIEYDNQRMDTFPRNYFVNYIKRRLLRNVDAFLCPAPAWDETLLSYGFKQDDVFYGLNTSDNDFWSEIVENVHFKDLPTSYFLTVGRQNTMKNLQKLIFAYNQYKKNGGKIPLVMVGDGSLHETLVEEAKDNEQIIFLPFQSREKIRELFVNMKALLLPSLKYETWGMVVNEAMASGSIIGISQECGSSTTLVEHKINGYIFNPHREIEILDCLHWIENLSELEITEMKKHSKNIITNWGLDRFSNGLFSAIQYAVNHKKDVNSMDKILMKLWKGRYNYKNTIK